MIGFVLNNIDIIFDITKIFGFFIAHWDQTISTTILLDFCTWSL